MSGIGHNRGPALGANSWARHCWTRARAELFPTLPIEVVRGRVRRAAEIGLDYRTYAGIRATTGHDLAAFLYSSNLLRMLRDAEADAARVARLGTAGGIRHHLALAAHLPPEAALARLAKAALATIAGIVAARPGAKAFAGTHRAAGAVEARIKT